ncbi:hypothetical protein [Phenylobacterium sp. J367]|uniref:hypothetical protein n=1 Tax=Phenylobacterium sp. J367 TaxID=2898435 RepID=UPI002150E631|nr:hypothetical protein [Phenylobacterium sp. J367]MCR5877295.1 hypothetical protein [Phenylobacterium sp. J367]
MSPGVAAKVAAALEHDPTLATSAARGRPSALLRAAERGPGLDVQTSVDLDRGLRRDPGLER